ncbi:MAG: glucan endo-1,6-beta-glucosidase [Candidatus Azobacteroides sp.]|nr:glucan endo-1,6-beta-glucosidase [Candidatus Azobacteroides sp.]
MKSIIYPASLCVLFFGCIDYNTDSGFTDEDNRISGDVHLWQTTRNEYYLFKESAVDYTNEIGDFSIRLEPEKTYQEMDGFGAALTGSSAFLIKQMSDEQRSALLNDLFNPETGAGMNYLRITIGSSDFSMAMYTYCDKEGIENFAVPEIDKRDLIPILKEILTINPEIKIMASPWSPPAWMKTGGMLNGGQLKPDKYADFAAYFVKYVQAMAREGIAIDAVTLQNEAMFSSETHPTMLMEWQQQAEIIRDYVGPGFRAAGITAKILILDHNFDLYQYPINVLNDINARQYVAGTAFHGYGGVPDAIDAVVAAHPDKEIYFSELSGGSGWNTDLETDRMETMFYYLTEYLIPCIQKGSKNFLMWNLALNTANGPTTPGGTFCEECRGVVTVQPDYSYKKELEYYLLGHFSKVCRTGSKRISTSIAGKLPDKFYINAFLNPDGSKGVVLVNRSGNKAAVTLKDGDRRLTYTIQNDAVASFLIKN